MNKQEFIKKWKWENDTNNINIKWDRSRELSKDLDKLFQSHQPETKTAEEILTKICGDKDFNTCGLNASAQHITVEKALKAMQEYAQIQLPSDEEIENNANIYAKNNLSHFDDKRTSVNYLAFIDGVKWLKQQIITKK